MRLKRIFVDKETWEGLYAVQYSEQPAHELNRIFTNWTDTSYLEEYLTLILAYLQDDYFVNVSIDVLIDKVIDEADELSARLRDFVSGGFEKNGKNLQMLFKPLHNAHFEIKPLQKHKAKIEDYNFPKPILRIYGIRIEQNTFIITGGAIKLVHEMKDHPDTLEELNKMERVKLFLKNSDINCEEDLKIYYEQS